MSLGVAVLGVGGHAVNKALPALAISEGLHIAGIWTRNHVVVREQAAKWRCKAYESAQACLGDPEVDAVYVALPTGLHATWGMEALLAGKHLWCEKSLSNSEADWVALVEQARRSNLGICECFAFPHHDQFTRLKALISNGEIGAVRRVAARFGFPHLSPNNIRYSERLGGGALYDAGCYPIAATRSILPGKPLDVYAVLEHEPGFEVDTSGSALLRYSDGVHAHLEWGFGRAYRNEIEIWGQTGSVLMEPAFTKPANLVSKLILRIPGQAAQEEEFAAGNQIAEMFSSFARAACDPAIREQYWKDADHQRELLFDVWRQGSSPDISGRSEKLIPRPDWLQCKVEGKLSQI